MCSAKGTPITHISSTASHHHLGAVRHRLECDLPAQGYKLQEKQEKWDERRGRVLGEA